MKEITKDNQKIAQKVNKFRKEAILNFHFWHGGVILADLGHIFKHSDKSLFLTTVYVSLRIGKSQSKTEDR